MEANGGKPDSYVDTTFRKHLAQLRVTSSDINGLPLGGRSLGNYFLDDCRHAIAHIRRKPGKKNLDLDKPDERTRLAISVRLVKAFAEHYIREALGLTNYLYLVRRKRGDFPTFVGAQMLQTGIYKEAYPASKNRTLRMTRRQTSN
jgi:hypothetical protein